MIEFISLCVCSACLSCICCLITGGLCVTGAGCRLRNKIVENHLPEDMQWLGNLPAPSEYCSESDSSSSSEFSPVSSRVCPREKKLYCCCKIMAKKNPKYCSNENCAASINSDIEKAKCSRSRSRGNKNQAVKSADKSRRPKRWTFCFRSKKSNEYGCGTVENGKNEEEEEVEEVEDEVKEAENSAIISEKREPKSCCICKRRKKSRRNSKNSSKTCCAYFRSCSCNNVKEIPNKRRSKNYKKSETSTTRYPADFHADKQLQPKKYRKSTKCSKNCPCKNILTDNKTFVVPKSERKIKKCRNCGARK